MTMPRKRTEAQGQPISVPITTPQEPPRAQRAPSPRARKKSAPTTELLLGEQDLFLFNEGTHLRLHEKLGAHPVILDGVEGTAFAVWAPDAEQVSVIGEFNDWNKTSHPLFPKGQSGLWERFFPDVTKGTIYKYHIASRHRGYYVDKADPFAFYAEVPPKTGSIVWDLAYEWRDQEWMATRRQRNALDAPIAIYEAHLGSWRRVPEENN